ncbi:hypothetical protein PanWU01x14_167300 [Parasponia andersonii]|uniref:Uncharacterized protein n=1 Tax=Parasponia andersonii TaxID=3476 RepID=A0A2P5CBD3_PARAD|nr:hypothetical protein PanWU01x14_167300 [Parasponia andersonii]
MHGRKRKSRLLLIITKYAATSGQTYLGFYLAARQSPDDFYTNTLQATSPDRFHTNISPVAPEITKSPKRLMGFTLELENSTVTNQTHEPFATSLTLGFDDNIGQVGKRKKSQMYPDSPAGTYCDCLAHEPPSPQDMGTAVDLNEFSSADVRVPDPNGSYCYYTTPTKLSPESTLRKSAMAFTNTPSIIRKRRHKTLCSSFSDVSCSPTWTISSAHEKDVNSTDFPNSKPAFISTHLCTPQTLVAVKSLGRRLKYAFNEAEDLAALYFPDVGINM